MERNYPSKKIEFGKFQFLFLAIFIFLSIVGNAQKVSTYTFAQSSGTYTTISSPTNVPFSGGVTTAWDDNVSNAITIPFTYMFNGINYTTLSVNSNGYVTFGDESATNDYSPISSTEGYYGTIAGFAKDLRRNSTGSTAITYGTSGTSPNRVFIIQWTNAIRFGITGDNINFQIRLYETTNAAQVMYGTCTATSTANTNKVQVGLRGLDNTDYNNRSDLGGNSVAWNALSAGTANSATVNYKSGLVPASGQTFTWTPPSAPTITSLSSSSGCSGSSLTINGTNLTGATAANVKVNGTAVSSITSNTGTAMVVVVNSGSGSVAVTTAGGTAIGSTYTTNPLPTATWDTAAAGRCFSALAQTTTLGYSATTNSPTTYSITWNASPTNTFATVTNASFSGTSTGGTITLNIPLGTLAGTYTGNITVKNANGCVSTSSQAFTITITNALPAAATTPSPATAATGICYAGQSPVTSISWAAALGATSYDVYFGAGSLPSTVTSNVTTTSYTTGTLLANTTYYWKILPKNSCGSPSATTWTFTTSATPCYCTPSGSGTTRGIAGVSFNGMTNLGTGFASYTDYSATKSATVVQGATYSGTNGLVVNVTTTAGRTYYQKAWIDWDQDGIFNTTTEEYALGTATNVTNGATSLSPLSITVPIGATIGTTRMRVSSRYTGYTTSCATLIDGEFEDYKIIVNAAPACVAPTNQATAFVLGTVTTTSVPATFSASATADGYLVIRSSTNTAPLQPVNGVTYSSTNINTLGGAFSFVQSGNSTSITGTGLSSATTYYYFIYAYNSNCTGGPAYKTGGALTGNGTTLTPTYCTPSSLANTTYIEGLATTGTLADTVSNSSSGYTGTGYDNNTSIVLGKQVPGGAFNIDFDMTGPGTDGSFVYVFVDWNSDGDFTDTGEIVYSTTSSSGSSTAIKDTTLGFIVPSTQTAGNYRMRIRTLPFNNTVPGTGVIDPCATGYTSGEAEDFTITIVIDCVSKISSVTGATICGTGTATLTATSAGNPTEYRWYTSKTGGTYVSTPTGSYTTPSISVTTTYYVTSYNGSCESFERVPVKATVKPSAAITFSPAIPVICGSGAVLTLTASGDNSVDDLFTEDFESGGFGNFTLNTINAINGAETFAIRTSSYQPTNTIVFRPAMNSGGAGTTGNKFAFATSDFNTDGSSPSNTKLNTALETTSTINTTSYTSLTLTFDQYYSDYGPEDSVIVEVNTGSGWNIVTTYTTDQGAPSDFANITLDFTPYINQATLKFRIRYIAGWNDGYALDNVRLYGTKPLVPAFVWGGATSDLYTDSNGTISYVPGTALATVYAKPDVTLHDTWDFTASVTLPNGCVVNQLVTVPNKTKIWKGAAAAPDYTTASSWYPAGIPDATNCVEIFNVTSPIVYPIIGSTAYAKTLTLKQSGATLNINSGQTLTVTDKVTVASGATLNIASSGSLVQITDGITNSGNITMTRSSRSMYRYDYVYHGSPVTGDVFSQIPSAYDLKYKFVTDGSSTGQWNTLTSTTLGEGFITRVKNIAPYSSTPTAIDFAYTGVPNNGTINMAIDSYDTSSSVSGNTKLFANPYPSAIDAGTFITANPILGAAIYLWTAHTVYSGSGLYVMADYIVWTKLGGTIVSPGGLTSNGKIAAGQGFFAQTFGDGTVSFNNTMRVAGNNSSFFKANNTVSDEPEMSRIWLNMSNDTLFHQMLLGYAPGASYGYDNLYDGLSFTTGEMDLYSIVGDKLLAVQGRPLPFDPNDVVPLGYKITTPGNYTIAIDHFDGLFLNNQNIYLEDKLLNVIHDIKASPYTFTATAGSFNDRFDLRYTDTTLGINDPKSSNLNAFISNDKLFVNASQNIINIAVYDISGKLIKTYNLKSPDKIFTNDFVFAKGVYIAKVKLENGTISIQKLIN